MKSIKESLADLFVNGLVVEFTKKNGETRTMICTLNRDVIPQEHHPKNADFAPIGGQKDFYRVFDLEKSGWRSIPKEGTEVIRVLNEGEAQTILSENAE